MRWQKLAAQHVLLILTGSHNVPDVHVTKADRIWWAVGTKIRSGCGKQGLYDCGTHRLGFVPRDWSLAAACEN